MLSTPQVQGITLFPSKPIIDRRIRFSKETSAARFATIFAIDNLERVKARDGSGTWVGATCPCSNTPSLSCLFTADRLFAPPAVMIDVHPEISIHFCTEEYFLTPYWCVHTIPGCCMTGASPTRSPCACDEHPRHEHSCTYAACREKEPCSLVEYEG